MPDRYNCVYYNADYYNFVVIKVRYFFLHIYKYVCSVSNDDLSSLQTYLVFFSMAFFIISPITNLASNGGYLSDFVG